MDRGGDMGIAALGPVLSALCRQHGLVRLELGVRNWTPPWPLWIERRASAVRFLSSFWMMPRPVQSG